MSSSTSPPCLDLDETAPIVAEWECDGVTHHLAKPDPKIDNITLRTRLSGTSALFEMRFPVNLKGIEGVTAITISIEPSSITSFEFMPTTTLPDTVKEKFNSRVTRLVFRLDKAVQILAPAAAKEPLAPARSQSGKVLDAVRMLCGTRAFIVYIDDKKLSKEQLQSVHDAVKRGGLQPLRDHNELTSLYHGTGAKIVDLPRTQHAPRLPAANSSDAPGLLSQAQDAPPSYDETEPPPPPAPINDRKRRRVDSEGKDNDAISKIWAELAYLKQENKSLRDELKARDERDQTVQHELADLKQENKSLRDELDQTRQQVAAFHQSLDALKQDVEHLQGQDKHNTDALEGYDTRLVELRDDLEDLDAKVDSIQEHRDENGVARDFLDKVRSDVYDDIITRLTG
ncbi:hypothetical protein FLONG3_9309 [Fusarium longipes]|uniref:Uncharacterized protein n=1 Tax=Fusarium longipes TaxID=694270 RepID=A0A395RZQ0_9HYPO|nr:hypothetical protein FLONG3_9309 [Fusarium longipes]